MQAARKFTQHIWVAITRTFMGRNFLWHLFSYLLTLILVLSGFDWYFFSSTRGDISNILGVTAGLMGFAMPLMLVLGLWLDAILTKNESLKRSALGVAVAGLTALIIVGLYKALTGRVEPEFLAMLAGDDISREFNFGILRYGVFWGWPSAHTGTAVAMSLYLSLVYKSKLWVALVLVPYAVFIALGAAVGFHWFSDVVAGAIIGSLIATVVYKQHKAY